MKHRETDNCSVCRKRMDCSKSQGYDDWCFEYRRKGQYAIGFVIVLVISLILMLFFMSGCIVKNAEKIEWLDGKKMVQTRTGVYAFGYWFGVDEYRMVSDPGGFYVGLKGDMNRPDPNTVNMGDNVSGIFLKGMK